MERAMFGVSLRDQIRNEEIHRITVIAQQVSKPNWQWAGHIAPRTDVLKWRPRTGKRSPNKVERRHYKRRWKPLETNGPVTWILELTKAPYQAVDVDRLK
ncbi:jg15462 [Pararge aegeria aegeria]|uniref:Jg15462 protein n=1 Tax=Pararge aegeria aegeria TaxID=348720 RepID=A0A8S4S6X2_9NEOP|nr:jg15462 [Pararge aegeria aegeria]